MPLDQTDHPPTAAESTRDLAELRRFCSHSLREPIHTIAIGLDLLDADDIVDAQRALIDRTVRDSVAGLERMATRLSDYLRLEAVDPAEVGIADATAAAARTVAARYPAVSLGIDAPDLTIVADPMLLCTAFVELFDNAARHGGEGSICNVDVGVTADERGHVIRVRDHGSPEWLDDASLVELFRHGRNGGPGVGLSVCRRITELHGGRLRLVADPADPHVELVFSA